MPDEPLASRAASASDVTRFRAFWNVVEDVQAQAVTGALDASTARARLLAVLRDQEAEVARSLDASALRRYREAQYALAATADDAFVKLEWNGADAWGLNPLETDLFGSRCAGQLVFDRIERLAGGTEAQSRALAEVYLTALALGFQGKYAGLPGSGEAIAEYRQRLRTLLFGNREDLAGPLVPQCYESTMTVGPGRRLPNVRAWWWAASAVVAVWLIVSSLLWLQLRTPAASGLDQAAVTSGGTRR